MNDIIEVKGLTKDYGSGKGVFDVDISVKKGEVYGYLGPNGAGKTTTIRQLMGFVRPDRGSCRILGMDCFSEAAAIHRRLGYLAGEIAFMEDMRGPEYLKFMADIKGIRDRSWMKELMERFELNPRGKIRRMSKGMKQKLGLVSAFMGRPEVLILDEPTSGLDPLMQNRFVELIREEKRRGTTILMSSHIFEEVERTCDRTAILRGGRIAAVEDMASLSGRKKKTYTVRLADAGEAKRLAEDGRLRVKGHRDCTVELAVGGDIPGALAVLSKYRIRDLDVQGESLEEVFMQYYGKEEGQR